MTELTADDRIENSLLTLGIKPSLGTEYRFVDMWGEHDPGACLLADDEIVAIGEEERFSRNKRGVTEFPHQSIEYVLDEAGVSLSDVDVIGIGRDPRLNLRWAKRWSSYVTPGLNLEKNAKVAQRLMTIAGSFANGHTRVVADKLSKHGELNADFHSVSHHRSHAASAAYCAPGDPVTLSIDAQGEYDATVLWDEDLNRIKTYGKENSIGYFYSAATTHLGYDHGSDAGKVMGLASYGEQNSELEQAFRRLTTVGPDGYDVSTFTAPDADSTSVFEKHFIPEKDEPTDFTSEEKDFAYHLQKRTEEIVIELVRGHIEQTGNGNVAIAGGVGMNCKLNREIKNLDCVDSLFIQPAANDSGICLGAALEAYRESTGNKPDPEFEHVYFGSKHSESAIRDALSRSKWEYHHRDDICADAATLLADGYLVGWFQGRMEYGARALGHRSILANPTNQKSLDLVNKNVKNREAWRPFAPSLLASHADEYLVNAEDSPYMIVLDEVKPSAQTEIPAVTHVDGTTRPQTVHKATAPKYHRLLSEFEHRTGVPVVLNTSFNVSGEPIVESPFQALKDFSATGLDALAMGDNLITKPEVPVPDGNTTKNT